mmetsp:Transcript_88652/g.286360  ORF Transcript_88652/g.286360 Transcript_88652/m.286360 type:complete len:284 (+) Transcript_88652:476-1327(+)
MPFSEVRRRASSGLARFSMGRGRSSCQRRMLANDSRLAGTVTELCSSQSANDCCREAGTRAGEGRGRQFPGDCGAASLQSSARRGAVGSGKSFCARAGTVFCERTFANSGGTSLLSGSGPAATSRVGTATASRSRAGASATSRAARAALAKRRARTTKTAARNTTRKRRRKTTRRAWARSAKHRDRATNLVASSRARKRRRSFAPRICRAKRARCATHLPATAARCQRPSTMARLAAATAAGSRAVLPLLRSSSAASCPAFRNSCDTPSVQSPRGTPSASMRL